VDGHDVRLLPLTVLRGAIGFVPQELFLFSADDCRQHHARRAGAWARHAALAE
jgi:ABC-type transport system involved in Fe-S cluster assembly fused permease/ATPase subunit